MSEQKSPIESTENALRQWELAGCVLFERRMTVPCVAMIYTGIDIAGWLDSGGNTSSGFKAWVDRYLLPDSGLPCTSVELYSARCAILHRGSADSDMTTPPASSVRLIVYSWGSASPDKLQSLKPWVFPSENALVVHINVLAMAFSRAIGRFIADLSADPVRADDVGVRARRCLVHLDGEPVEFLAARKREQEGGP